MKKVFNLLLFMVFCMLCFGEVKGIAMERQSQDPISESCGEDVDREDQIESHEIINVFLSSPYPQTNTVFTNDPYIIGRSLNRPKAPRQRR